jgi:glycine/D-amino acid oxidase-like deaminating enzyme
MTTLAGSRIGRRQWLATAALPAASALLGGCATRRSDGRAAGAGRWPTYERRFARVRVSPDRVIRTVVGLRPFRQAGFRVEVERLDQKVVVHNYGHGGGGITLSWGTADLALESALATGLRRFAVIGCGAVGLATARLLQQRGCQVTIYARDLPPDTTSNIAGAQWGPFSVVDRDRRAPAFMTQFVRASRFSYRYFQHLLGDRYGVRWIENYVLSDQPAPAAPQPEVEGLMPEARELRRDEHPFPASHVRMFASMFIEPPVYLAALEQDVRLAGGRIEVRELRDRTEIATLPEPGVINCTGLGARALFNDEEMLPIKGQLHVLLPQPDVDYLLLAQDLYMFPRRDGILLGGTFERGEWSLEPNREAEKRILDGHARIFSGMSRP